ncbi:nSTAND1 domain-containing NTPase [Methylomonas sp. MgM2]
MSSLKLDADNPWPGLESFDEPSAKFFHGRSKESHELFLALNRAPLTVLYGQSGLGKTSLLRAGLFPLLREADYLPVYIRLDHGEDSPPLLEQIQRSLLQTAEESRCELPAFTDDESLWAYLHRDDLEIWSRGSRLMTPVLVFDQFEELFTLGRRGAASNNENQAFLAVLACLVENRVPAALEQALEAGPELARHLDFRKQDYKLLLAFREDYLPEVEELRPLMPSIAQNRLRLLPLSQPQALQAVEKSGGSLLTHEVAERIVNFVASAQQSQQDEESAKQFLNDVAVEPALLSLVCAGLNNHRKQQGLATITVELLKSCQTTIIENFYKQSLEGLHPAVRAFIEEDLLTRAGHRDSRALDDALAVPGITQEAIDRLVTHRLLRVDERYGQKRLELIHDRLTETVRISRDRRQNEEAQAAAQRKAKRRRKRFWMGIGAVASLMALLAAFAGYSFLQWQRAEEQTRRAEQRKQAMMDAINRLTYEVPERLLMRPGLEQLAQQIFEANVKMLEELLAQEGDTPDVLREKASNFVRIGDLRIQFGDLDGALRSYRACLEIIGNLAEQDPGNSQWQRDLSVSHIKVGYVLSAEGNLADALREYRASLEIVEGLAEQDPDNSQWQQDLYSSHTFIGIVLVDQGDLTGALKEYQNGFAIIERLATLDNRNIDWQRELSVSHNKVGDVLSAQGDLAGALKEYRASLKVTERLAEQDPGNSQWQRDLSVGVLNVGWILEKQGNKKDARQSYRQARQIIARLREQSPDWAVLGSDLEWLDKRLEALK